MAKSIIYGLFFPFESHTTTHPNTEYTCWNFAHLDISIQPYIVFYFYFFESVLVVVRVFAIRDRTLGWLDLKFQLYFPLPYFQLRVEFFPPQSVCVYVIQLSKFQWNRVCRRNWEIHSHNQYNLRIYCVSAIFSLFYVAIPANLTTERMVIRPESQLSASISFPAFMYYRTAPRDCYIISNKKKNPEYIIVVGCHVYSMAIFLRHLFSDWLLTHTRKVHAKNWLWWSVF